MKIELLNITKKFGSVLANDDVCLKVSSGEVIALLGENGAGKSTLMKVLFGIYQPDFGSILIDDKEVILSSPNDAIMHGMGMVFQQFNLISALTVIDNLILAFPEAPFWTFRKIFKKQNKHLEKLLIMLERMAPDINPNQLVSTLSVGQRQVLELVKVLNQDSRYIILDEPTSVLTPQESEKLWTLIRELAESGRTVILITHKMEDVMACADQIVVLRNGKVVKQMQKDNCTEGSLVKMMMGEQADRPPLSTFSKKDYTNLPPKIDIRCLSVSSSQGDLKPLDIKIRKGEILGVAGVSGSGQHLLADALMGLQPLKSGEVIVDGKVVQSVDRRTLGPSNFAYIPEQPAVNAVAPDLNLTINISLSNLNRLSFIPDWNPEIQKAEKIISKFNVRPNNLKLLAGKLSGGNLQKLVVGRELEGEPDFIIAAYPTMGLDANATRDVYEALFKKAEQGAAILWISEDIDDLLQYSNTIAVMYQGEIKKVYKTHETDRYQIGRAMSGVDVDLFDSDDINYIEISMENEKSKREVLNVY